MTTFLTLPYDLIEEIIIRTWELNLFARERILLMTSLPLVCKTVLDAYLRISSTYVYIPCPAYVERFLQILREGFRHYPVQKHADYAKDLCRSIALDIEPDTQASTFQWNVEPPMGAALSDLLYNLRIFGDLPNFRTLIIRYINADINDIFDWVRFIDFPKTVELLDLESMQTEEKKSTEVVSTVHTDNAFYNLWTLPSLLHLRVLGGSRELVSHLIFMAPNLLTVDYLEKSQEVGVLQRSRFIQL